MGKVYITYAEVEEFCREVLKRWDPGSVDLVALSRGGLIPASIISEFSGVEPRLIGISSYSGTSRKSLEVYQLPPPPSKEKALIVDDVNDSGASLELAVDLLREKGYEKIYTAVIAEKPRSSFRTDFYLKKTDRWVVFPWEKREYGYSGKDGKYRQRDEHYRALARGIRGDFEALLAILEPTSMFASRVIADELKIRKIYGLGIGKEIYQRPEELPQRVLFILSAPF